MPRVAVDDPTLTVLLLLGLAAVAAGFVDAAVGGGGLIQLPALLLGLPSAARCRSWPPTSSSSICGTTVSSATYYRRIGPDPRTFIPLMGLAFLGADRRRAGGLADPPRGVRADRAGRADRGRRRTSCSSRPRVETTVLRLRRALGTSPRRWGSGSGSGSTTARSGPGTGSFFVVSLVALLGYDFLQASAKARLANWATNLGALCVFVPQGAVLWKVGLVMGACNLLGGYVGARVAVWRGVGFVRVFFIVVVSAFIVRIGGDVFGVW